MRQTVLTNGSHENTDKVGEEHNTGRTARIFAFLVVVSDNLLMTISSSSS